MLIRMVRGSVSYLYIKLIWHNLQYNEQNSMYCEILNSYNYMYVLFKAVRFVTDCAYTKIDRKCGTRDLG